jgi:hypothetical protein
MQCSSCRAEAPANVAYCPVCGNPISSSAQSLDQSTIMSSPGVSQPIYPSTNYGPSSYQGLQQNPYNNPYEQPSPYATNLPQPLTPVIGNGTLPPVPSPVPSPRPNRTRVFLIIGVSVLVLILIVVSINLYTHGSLIRKTSWKEWLDSQAWRGDQATTPALSTKSIIPRAGILSTE